MTPILQAIFSVVFFGVVIFNIKPNFTACTVVDFLSISPNHLEDHDAANISREFLPITGRPYSPHTQRSVGRPSVINWLVGKNVEDASTRVDYAVEGGVQEGDGTLCESHWVPGLGDDALDNGGLTFVGVDYQVTETLEQCRALCSDNSDCVVYVWRQTLTAMTGHASQHGCILKGDAHVQGAYDQEFDDTDTVVPLVSDYCLYSLISACQVVAGFECMHCEGDTMARCVWYSEAHVVGARDCSYFDNYSQCPFVPDKPTTNPTTTSKPTTPKPTTSTSSTAKPTTSTPSTAKPTTSTSSTAKPTTLTSSTAKPTTSTSSTAKPTTSTPSTAKPTTSTSSTPSTTSRLTSTENETSSTTTTAAGGGSGVVPGGIIAGAGGAAAAVAAAAFAFHKWSAGASEPPLEDDSDLPMAVSELEQQVMVDGEMYS